MSLSGSELLTRRGAYLAMYYFIEAYFKRSRNPHTDLVMLMHNVRPESDPTDGAALHRSDSAYWPDWIAAVGKALEEGIPESH